MLPVGEINLVVGGIATFAASVGYVFTRRLRADPRSTEGNGPDQSDSTTNPPMDPKSACVTHEEPATSLDFSDPKTIANPMESEPIESSAPIPPPSRRPSLALKRKRSFDDDDDDPPADAGYPHNLATIYPPPKKRTRTPSTDEKTDLDVSATDVTSAVDQGPAKEVEESCPPSTDPVPDTVEKSPSVPSPEPDSSNSASLPSPPRTPKHSPRKNNEPLPIASAPASGVFFGTPVTMSSTGTPRTPLPSRTATVNAFSAFSGTASPFASFRAASPSRSSKPVWTSQENDISGPTVLAPNEVSVSDATSSAPPSKSGHALEAVLASKSTVEYLTGEEDEDVELELKGIKLYIKRGDKPFADGVVGHIKLLSNRTTLDERLLFRREPLWKVSMNVRIHPTVRCTYEAEENILRLILQEYIEQPNIPQEDWKKEIVVYALKPSRSCSKQDFNDFANSLVDCPGLKPR